MQFDYAGCNNKSGYECKQYLHFLAVAFHIHHSLDLKSTDLKVHPALAGDHCIVKHKAVVHCTGMPGVLVQVGIDQEFEHEVVHMMAVRAREKVKLFTSYSKMKTKYVRKNVTSSPAKDL